MPDLHSKVIEYAGTRQDIDEVAATLNARAASDAIYRELALHRLKRMPASPVVVRQKTQLARVIDQLEPSAMVQVVRVRVFGKARVMYVTVPDKTVLGWYEDDA